MQDTQLRLQLLLALPVARMNLLKPLVWWEERIDLIPSSSQKIFQKYTGGSQYGRTVTYIEEQSWQMECRGLH